MTGETIPFIDRINTGDAANVMKALPCDCVDLIITSPPYWNAVQYAQESKQSGGDYEDYLASLLAVWIECERVLRPNGKLAINTPIMPIPKSIIGDQHTRHLKNINNDVERTILDNTEMQRYSLFVWQKQTSKLMFGSYPYPGNLLENNTVEFINVLVKPGAPPKYPKAVKEQYKLTREEWVDLTQQVWFMYPEDVKRARLHPAPFPIKLPGRLIKLYTYGRTDGFPGEIVLDPFCGTGATCLAAKMMGRRFIGIELSEEYVNIARQRLDLARFDEPLLLVGRPKHPTRDDLLNLQLDTSGKIAQKKHKRDTYGRKLSSPNEIQTEFL